MEDRKFKIVDRLGPFLPEKYQKEDLQWSIEEIKSSDESKIKELEEKQKEVCQEYCKEHHKVTVGQVKEIFKFVQKTLEANHEQSIEHNPELQQHASEVINNIINSTPEEDTQ